MSEEEIRKTLAAAGINDPEIGIHSVATEEPNHHVFAIENISENIEDFNIAVENWMETYVWPAAMRNMNNRLFSKDPNYMDSDIR